MSDVYIHKKSGRKYVLLKDTYKTTTVKQGSSNEWEEAFFYVDTKTLQTFVTGKKRWEENFERELKYEKEN